MSKFLKSARFSTTTALKLRRVTEKKKRRVPFKRLAADETVVVVVPLVVLFLLSLSILVVVVTDIFFFCSRFQTAVVSLLRLLLSLDATTTRFYNNKSFRLASSCALYIIRLILTRALRSTVVGVLLSLFPSGTRRSGGSTLEEKLAGFFSREKPRFFSQTLNPKRKRKISQKLNCNFQTHTHTETRLNAFHTTRAKRNTRISRSKRTEEYFLSLFFFGVLLILDTNFASLARAFSALFESKEFTDRALTARLQK